MQIREIAHPVEEVVVKIRAHDQGWGNPHMSGAGRGSLWCLAVRKLKWRYFVRWSWCGIRLLMLGIKIMSLC